MSRSQDPVQCPLKVVGIDPGLANLGLAAIIQDKKDALYLDSKLVRTSSRSPQAERLQTIFSETSRFLKTHQPQALALEGQYFHQQRDTAFKVGQAVGVCLLAAAELKIPVFEYGPLQVKQSLVGTGSASKAQVTFMVRALLKLTASPESHHVADALALALTHLSSYRLKQL